MADPNAFVHDPRRRNLAVLAVIALVTVALAALALWHQASLVAPKYTPKAFFPDLAAHNRQIARIHIDSQKYGAFDVVFEPSKGWVLPAEHDYPADFARVRQTIVGMAGLETIAPKTSRPDWLHYLDLVAPSKSGKKTGTGTQIALLDEHGHAIAGLIAGKTKDIGEPDGATGLFVRKPDSNQSWLVRSVFTPQPDPAAWQNKDVVSIDRGRIAEVDVSPPDGPSYVVRRDKASDPDFALADLPKGRMLSAPEAPDGVADALVDFTFDKVVPVSQFDFSNAARLVTKTFDGLIVTARVLKLGEAYWVRLEAETAPGRTNAATEARTVNKHAAGWAFEIPAYKGAQFTTSRDSLLKPVESTGRKPARKR